MKAETRTRGIAREALAVLVTSCASACDGGAAPPVGGALVIADTDLAVPTIAGRLRVDLYAEDGTWFLSRDVLRNELANWPVSFGVYAPDALADHVVTIRLRAYPEAGVRDYRGEQFVTPPSPSDDPLAVPPPPPYTNQPRLFDDTGTDITPPTEPQPALTVDRLLRVRLHPGVRGSARVMLAGACVGTQADIQGGTTCIDAAGARVAVAEVALDPDETVPTTSAAGTFGALTPCMTTPRSGGLSVDGAPLYDAEACVPGSAYVFGTSDGALGELPDLPERVALVPPFLMDRYEVTVARWRVAVTSGFQSPDATPTPNEGPIPTSPTPFLDPTMCAWSTSSQNRESFALTCISWAAARAYCRSLGGDLPTEVQWEYAATVAGRPYRTRYPWGGDDTIQPTCDRAVWGRGEVTGQDQQCEIPAAFGPLPVAARDSPTGDVSALGIVGLGAGVVEWTEDSFASFSSNCWMNAPLTLPGCDGSLSQTHAIRSSSWRDNVASLIPANRRFLTGSTSATGFRCVRPGAP